MILYLTLKFQVSMIYRSRDIMEIRKVLVILDKYLYLAAENFVSLKKNHSTCGREENSIDPIFISKWHECDHLSYWLVYLSSQAQSLGVVWPTHVTYAAGY